MESNNLPSDVFADKECMEKQLTRLNSETKHQFDQAEQLIKSRLQAAIASLDQSATAIRMLLSAQSPADRETPSGVALRHDLEKLLTNSNDLTRMANTMQQDFGAGRQRCEQRTGQQVANVVAALEQHRACVQDMAIALTQATLEKARTPFPTVPVEVLRTTDRRLL